MLRRSHRKGNNPQIAQILAEEKQVAVMAYVMGYSSVHLRNL